MVINLNKKQVTRERLLKYIDDTDIYQYYIEDKVSIGTGNILSPLREEKKPSFGFFKGVTGDICFNDFGFKKGDVFKFVELLFGLTHYEALSKIVVDFNLDKHFYYKETEKTSKTYNPKLYPPRELLLRTANKRKLGVRKRKWQLHDIAFWEQFGITKAILNKYNVTPIDYIFFGDDRHPVLADRYAYVFREYKDGQETLKIYQPYSENYKWLNNHNFSVWQGWKQLPKKHKKVIITKSLKDVMSIVNVLGIPSVSLQSESVMPKQKIIDELSSRFESLYLLYDNDFDKPENTGEMFGANIVEDQYICQLSIPTKYKSKDFSDLVKNYGRIKAEEIYRNEIEEPF